MYMSSCSKCRCARSLARSISAQDGHGCSKKQAPWLHACMHAVWNGFTWKTADCSVLVLSVCLSVCLSVHTKNGEREKRECDRENELIITDFMYDLLILFTFSSILIFWRNNLCIRCRWWHEEKQNKIILLPSFHNPPLNSDLLTLPWLMHGWKQKKPLRS